MEEKKIFEEICKVIEQIERRANYMYSCDKKTGIYRQEKVIQVITAACKIEVSYNQTGENRIYKPRVYQSCMNPSQIEIKTLQILMLANNKLMIKSGYETELIPISEVDIQIKPWEAKIYKASCNPCMNCGKCSW